MCKLGVLIFFTVYFFLQTLGLEVWPYIPGKARMLPSNPHEKLLPMDRARMKKFKNLLGHELAETQEKNSCRTLSSADGRSLSE